MSSSKKLMNIFTEDKQVKPSDIARKDWRTDILEQIRFTGTAGSNIKLIQATRQHVLEFSHSQPCIRRSLVKKFNLIVIRPSELADNDTIRCSICGHVLFMNREPVWHYLIKYERNWFACFVCFDINSPSRPSTKCYRRE